MVKHIKQKIEILDCTIRDGGYVNNWNFDLKLVRESYRALSKAGVDYVELGYHGTEKYFDKKTNGCFRFSAPDDIKEICQGILGAKVSLMVDFGKFDTSDLSSYKDTPVKLIRLAFYKNSIKEALEEATRIKKMGFVVSANLMGFSTYTPSELKKLINLLAGVNLDYVYIADTYGSMLPNDVINSYKSLLKLKHVRWGYHPHNNLQMSFANTLAAIDAGVKIVDSSIFGMGRGAGNLPTEILLAYLQNSKPYKYNAVPVLNLIDHFYADLHRQYRWGYNLAYMISGMYGCHPNYAKNLIDRKEYDIEDTWKILEIIKSKNPISYNKDLVEDILKNSLFKNKTLFRTSKVKNNNLDVKKPKVSYLNRYQNHDFLIFANGPSLKKYKIQIQRFIDKYKPVTMGGNYLESLFKPDYHAFSNKRRFIDYIDTVNKDSRLLISQHISDVMVNEYTNREYEKIIYEDIDGPFAINKEGVINSNCRSVAILLIAVALVMGARRIFVVGLDGYMNIGDYTKSHFYFEKDEAEEQNLLTDKHLANLRYLEQIDDHILKEKKEGVHILTPTSYTRFYKGVENYI